MRAQSAILPAVRTITTTITVAAGVFAPGHLGELNWQVPFELADAVLEETRAAQRRLRVVFLTGTALRERGFAEAVRRVSEEISSRPGDR